MAHAEIDLKNAGFANFECESLSDLSNKSFIDSFSYFHPNIEDVYSYWNHHFGLENGMPGGESTISQLQSN